MTNKEDLNEKVRTIGISLAFSVLMITIVTNEPNILNT